MARLGSLVGRANGASGNDIYPWKKAEAETLEATVPNSTTLEDESLFSIVDR